MRIMLDTNILIPLEDSSKVLDDSFSDLIRLSHANSHTILLHPRSIEDIHRDKNESRKSSMLSRIHKYDMLENADTFSDDLLIEYNINGNKENDDVDNAILAATYYNAVHLLVTEDRGIHKKASKLGISDSVLYLQQVVDVLKRLHPSELQVFHPNLQNLPLHQINIRDSFFDSLREDYAGFNEWYTRSASDGRKAWINSDPNTNNINALLIYKPEESEVITEDFKALPNKSLKISTFKVSEQIRGRRIGELLFKTIFEYAYKNGYSWIYLTIHPDKHEFLKDMCIDLGFYSYGIDIKSKRDDVFIKQVGVQIYDGITNQAFEFYRKYSPSIMCGNTSKYIIPIQQVYHEVLFPDNQSQLSLFADENAVGNTIKKAYLSHAQANNIKPGDIVLFYRSGDEKRLTTLAIVEDYFISNDAEYIASKVAKRTVYSFSDIQAMSQKNTKVLLFRQIFHFNNKIDRNWMKRNNIIRGNIQSTRSISDDAFKYIMEKENAENCANFN